MDWNMLEPMDEKLTKSSKKFFFNKQSGSWSSQRMKNEQKVTKTYFLKIYWNFPGFIRLYVLFHRFIYSEGADRGKINFDIHDQFELIF